MNLELTDVLVRRVRRPRLNLLAKAYVILSIRSSLFPEAKGLETYFLEHAGVLVNHFDRLLAIRLV